VVGENEAPRLVGPTEGPLVRVTVGAVEGDQDENSAVGPREGAKVGELEGAQLSPRTVGLRVGFVTVGELVVGE
jgi:hypothetical protein